MITSLAEVASQKERSNQVKVWRIVIVLLLGLVLAGSISCNPLGQNQQSATTQQVEVVSGNLTVTISGSGNIELSKEAKLTFGAAGRIEKIHVQEHDKVSKGQVLAKLETDNLELAVLQAKTALSQAQTAQSQAEIAKTQAEAGVAVAQFTLDRIKEVNDIKDEITRLQTKIDVAVEMIGFGSNVNWDVVKQIQAELARKKQELGTLLGEPEFAGVVTYDILSQKYGRWVVDDVRIKELQLKSAQQAVTQSQAALEQTQSAIELAQKSLSVAEKQLKDATITAPFDGVVADVYVKERDFIPSPTVTIIHLIDPGSMQLKIEVDELDVAKVKLGQRATIEVDALPTLGLEDKVSSISLSPAPKAGVVVYYAEINLHVGGDSGLRDGMSATADIIVAERNDVLLVPERAINRDNPDKPTVEVMINGQIKERTVVTGVSDGIQTEILEGLKKGEVVVEKRSTPQSSVPGLF